MWAALFALVIVAGTGLGLVSTAAAAVQTTVKTKHYSISGKSGEALVAAMDRQGPKHGFLARAIAQTKYTMGSDATWVHESGKCRPVNPVVRLDITYIYPQVSERVALPLKLRWKRFMRGVEKHEKVHGSIARQMADAANKAIGKMRFADNFGCLKSRMLMKQRLNEIVAIHEKKQFAFDEREHRDGGPVDSLLGALRK